jgi:hypothetical protein
MFSLCPLQSCLPQGAICSRDYLAFAQESESDVAGSAPTDFVSHVATIDHVVTLRNSLEHSPDDVDDDDGMDTWLLVRLLFFAWSQVFGPSGHTRMYHRQTCKPRIPPISPCMSCAQPQGQVGPLGQLDQQHDSA